MNASAPSTGMSMSSMQSGSRIIRASRYASIVSGVFMAAFGLRAAFARMLSATRPKVSRGTS